MNRRHCIQAVLLTAGMLAALLLATGASAQSQHSSIGTITVKSRGCSEPLNQKQYRYETYACATITMPRQSVAGQTITVIYKFKARTELKFVEVCFVPVAGTKCANKLPRKYSIFPKGKIVTEALQMTVPDKPGTYGVYNNTRLYRPGKSKYADMSLYWAVPAFERVLAAAS